LINVFFDQLDLLRDLLSFVFFPLIEIIKSLLIDSLQMSQGSLSLLRCLNNLPEENRVIKAEAKLDRVDFVLNLLLILAQKSHLV